MDTYSKAFLIPLQRTLATVVSFVPRFFVAAVLFALMYVVAVLIRRLTRKALEKVPHIPWAVRVLISRSIYLTTLVIGILVALSAAEVNVTAVIASLGVAGFALGFALKDILENFIAGILLLFARPFEVGDQITSGAFEGTVFDIQIRTTTIHTYDHQIVVIPNAQVFTSPVVNHTRLGRRRYQVDFDTSVSADGQLVEREAVAAATSEPSIEEKPAPFVLITKVNSGSDVLSWRLYFWAKPTKADELGAISAILKQLKHRLFDAGVPTPTSTSAVNVLSSDRKTNSASHAPESV
jgi:small conductance mechanosensitive channel